MAFDPNEPRDSHGRWTDGGAGAAPTDDPRTLDVGGDKWNKDIAAKLEKEYAAQRPALDKMAHEAAKAGVEVHAPASDWESIPSDIQQEAEDAYISNNLDDQLTNETESWQESGGGLNDAAHELAQDNDWKHEKLEELIKDRDENEEERIPYSVNDLAAAISISPPEYDGYKNDEKKPEITFDDSKLEHPDNLMSADQLSLPGIDAPKPHESLTQKMRDDITSHLESAFGDEAESKASNMEPPSYLAESAKEALGEMWDQWDDENKYEFAKNGTNLLDDSENVESGKVSFPSKFDPLNETTGKDYRDTQRMAKYLSTERAAQLLEQRGIKPSHYLDPKAQTMDGPNGEKLVLKGGKWEVDKPGSDAVDKDDIAKANHELWEGWKGDSANDDGKLIQAAAHEELGGRLNTSSRGVSAEAAKVYANQSNVYRAIGGYEGVKALLRATWETTQYMLDRSNDATVNLYRGLRVPDLKPIQDGIGFEDAKTGERVAHEEVDHDIKGSDYLSKTHYTKLPELNITRNGASSWTTDPTVANNWTGGNGTKIVMRAEVPRTSILSVPAYGVNIFSEHEVVVMGTALKHWDVWHQKAPKIGDIPFKAHVAKAPPQPKKTTAEKEHFA